MISIAVVDSGPLLAAANRADPDHERCVAVLERLDLRLVIPALCIAEVTYLLGRQCGSAAEARFLRGLSGFDVRSLRGDEWGHAADLVERYSDFPLGGTDAT
ncbi:MAG TPA: PIN domain-containing protein, partial [Thermoanaerobaculia bacterium]|nr:PIN domain-containing protein [Thermoanaerobaculia bacterium]